MYRKLFVLLALGAIIAACNRQEKPKEEKESAKQEVQKMSITVTSTAFEAEGMIPAKYTCDGANVSPPLAFEGIPDGSKSLVLISDDPDAPAGTWVHWVLYNLPPETRQLPEKMPVDEKLPSGASHGVTDFGRFGYGGPCPPRGTHRYRISADAY